MMIPAGSCPSQIVVLIFGCAEVLMGFQLANGGSKSSVEIYIPYWQGALVQNIWVVNMQVLIVNRQKWCNFTDYRVLCPHSEELLCLFKVADLQYES